MKYSFTKNFRTLVLQKVREKTREKSGFILANTR